VRHLAELHGGSVSVASQGEGQGATFTVTLPPSLIIEASAKAVQEELNGRHEKTNHELNGIRILIVDDDADTCEMLAVALSLMGAEAQASNSVQEAFVSMAHWEPDILLTDINMPGEDGYSLIHKLRSSTPEKGANIPAIALTALARQEDSEQALSAGFQLHLAKPIDIEILAEAIVNLTNKSH